MLVGGLILAASLVAFMGVPEMGVAAAVVGAVLLAASVVCLAAIGIMRTIRLASLTPPPRDPPPA